jgi:pimeloyl-ACP methyl ester carboxylesterase/DNA-binding CsgD family transcriptional regulator
VRPVETRYARSGEIRIAYQVVGQGSLDLVLVPGFISNLDVLWEDPGYSHLVKRLSAFSRLILFDKRGTGLSDRVDAHAPPDFPTRTDDIRAVMDAAGCTRAALLGSSEGAAMSVLFAATYPERVRALVLHCGYVYFDGSVMDQKRFRSFIEAVEIAWGSGATLAHVAPSRVDDHRFAEWWARFERLSASPTAAATLARMNGAVDVRAALSTLQATTLLIHRVDDAYVELETSRYVARAIKGSRLVEIPGRDHPIWMGDVDLVADLVEEFLTGERPVADSNRVLAVLLVARIIGGSGSGRFARHMKARHLSERVELFHEAALKVIERYGGHADWSGAEKIVARFDGAAKATAGAIALRETAASLELAIAQGIHVGEIDTSLSPLFGISLDVADRIAAAAQPPEILLSRLVGDLVSGSGLQFVERGKLAIDGIHEQLPVLALVTERHLEPILRKTRLADLDALSAREREVLAFVTDGLSNSSIAMQLGLSEHTVKRHVANILLKLDLPTRAAAAALMARQPAQ